jgi:hypothetical protein
MAAVQHEYLVLSLGLNASPSAAVAVSVPTPGTVGPAAAAVPDGLTIANINKIDIGYGKSDQEIDLSKIDESNIFKKIGDKDSILKCSNAANTLRFARKDSKPGLYLYKNFPNKHIIILADKLSLEEKNKVNAKIQQCVDIFNYKDYQTDTVENKAKTDK